MRKNSVVVVIPFYQNHLDYNSLFSLKQCFNTLSEFHIVAIKPKSLEFSKEMTDFHFQNVISFEDFYFKSIAGYNNLMLSVEFYEKFLSYNYLLIYQQDAFVFSNKLEYWCNRNFDYVGAPWLYPHSKKSIITPIKSYIYRRFDKQKFGLPSAKQLFNQVGNGGLSLRRTEKFYEILSNSQSIKQQYLSRQELEFNEDIFWSIAINRKKKQLSIPNYKKAIHFSIETEPGLGLTLTKNILPFGCHAWDKHLDFWQPILEKYGYDPH